MAKEEQRQYLFIDGFRAIAALMVCNSHIFNIIDAQKVLGHLKEIVLKHVGLDISLLINFMSHLFSHAHVCGDTGLDMFFVISGFLITEILLKNKEGQANLKNFYLRRFFKIVPSYSCVVFVALYVYFSNSHLSLKEEFLTTGRFVLFLQSYFPPVPGLNHTWSLVVEEHFYIFYPIMLWMIFKCTPKKTQKFHIISRLLIVIFLVNLQRYSFYHTGTTFLYSLYRSYYIFQTTTFRVDALAFGCLLCVLKEYWGHKAPKVLGWVFIILAAIFFITFLKISQTNFFYYPLDYLSAGFLMAGIYISGFRWGIENKWLVFLGRCSYNLYLWHFLFIGYLGYWTSRFDPLVVILVYFCIFLLTGLIGTYCIERPFLKLGKSIVQRIA